MNQDRRYEAKKEKFQPKKEGDVCKYPCDGSTATVAMLVGNKFYIYSCGDSSCVCVKKSKSFERFTRDHNTLVPAEVERCIAGGAT